MIIPQLQDIMGNFAICCLKNNLINNKSLIIKRNLSIISIAIMLIAFSSCEKEWSPKNEQLYSKCKYYGDLVKEHQLTDYVKSHINYNFNKYFESHDSSEQLELEGFIGLDSIFNNYGSDNLIRELVEEFANGNGDIKNTLLSIVMGIYIFLGVI